MDKRIHFIWGDSSRHQNRIGLLKKNGMNKIYVLDKKQSAVIKERDDVVYFSLKFALLLNKDQPGRVHHFFMNVPPRKCGKADDNRNTD